MERLLSADGATMLLKPQSSAVSGQQPLRVCKAKFRPHFRRNVESLPGGSSTTN